MNQSRLFGRGNAPPSLSYFCRRCLSVVAAPLLVAALGVAPAYAGLKDSLFELDGNAKEDVGVLGDDWDTLNVITASTVRRSTGIVADTGPEAARPMAAGRRLLLVEDDVSVAVVALELLESLGLEVRAVETAPQALDLLKREKFDMMLSDVVMPGGMTGIELARMCGRDYPDMRVVLTSGYAGEDVDAALADAPWPFLRKPYSGDQLARVLGELA